MKNTTIESEKSGLYQPGLNEESEAVISAHFMHHLNHNLNLKLYHSAEFSKRALNLSSRLIFDRLIPSLLEASDQFILERISAVKIRAGKNFKEYGLSAAKQVGLSELIAEVMFDRQFLKGPKSNYSRLNLTKKIKELVGKHQPIKMVIPALPFKSSSPLKTRGILPDLSEVNFLLGLAEIAKTINLIYSEEITIPKKTWAKFTVISDGRRFNTFLNEPVEGLQAYQNQLRWWIDKLQISNYVEIIDYQWVMSHHLPKILYLEKRALREKLVLLYREVMTPIFNPYDMQQTINKAVELDPDPESCNSEGRYIPLFKSLIYIVRYKTLLTYVQTHGKNYTELYPELTRHIFQPYAVLKNDEVEQLKEFLANPQSQYRPDEAKLLEYLRQSMLREAWNAAINYIAEIRSDRDLCDEPIQTCFPEYIRWTIHAKLGQLAVLTTTASGDPVQAWHGVGVFKLTKNNKIKLYTLPVLSLEGAGAIPVTILNDQEEFMIKNQPLFYVHPELTFKDSDELLNKIAQYLTRKRKF